MSQVCLEKALIYILILTPDAQHTTCQFPQQGSVFLCIVSSFNQCYRNAGKLAISTCKSNHIFTLNKIPTATPSCLQKRFQGSHAKALWFSLFYPCLLVFLSTAILSNWFSPMTSDIHKLYTRISQS